MDFERGLEFPVSLLAPALQCGLVIVQNSLCSMAAVSIYATAVGDN